MSSLTTHQLEQLNKYSELLLYFGKSRALLSKAELSKEGIALQIRDCLLAGALMRSELDPSMPVFDIGSGNGLPGIVFSVLWEDQSFLLVERNLGKATVLDQIAKDLKLTNTKVIDQAVETLNTQSIEHAVCRAFSPMSTTLILLKGVIKSGGSVFHLKGPSYENELKDCPTEWSNSLLGEYSVEGKVRVVIHSKKR